MKRMILIFLLCCTLLCIPAAAVSSASDLTCDATVQTDGSCRVSITMQLHPDSTVSDLTFPIPGEAVDVQLSGAPVQTRSDGDLLLVLLPQLSPGTYPVSLSYTLPRVIREKKGEVLLDLPLLSGFAYPISSMEFSVTLPGSITGEPSFLSGYHQHNIASQITTEIEGSTLRGHLEGSLKDHETLQMTLPVDPDLFASNAIREPLLSGMDWAILGCIVLACAYFALTLLPRIPRIRPCPTPPEGVSAGEVGTCMTGYGTDLTLMVITWAQLGYLLIEIDRRGRVLLHKRMDMGNERSGYEIRCFQKLFGSKTTVDGTSYHYALLCRKMAVKSPLRSQLYRPNSGNPRIFRILCCVAGLLCGVQMGLSLVSPMESTTLPAVLLGGLAFAFSYFIQSGGKCLPLRNKMPLIIAVGCGILWIVLGFLTGCAVSVIPMVIFQFAAGLGAAYGGKRSELGLRCLSQLQGLRKHMTSAQSFDLQQLLQRNPNYFFELAPYALALGVDKKFARRFGKLTLPDCGYLLTDTHHDMTAAQWAAKLRQAADILNARQKRLPYERFTGK